MKLIIGLGNPGEKYKNTRHNIGFQVLDELKTEISNDKFLISPDSLSRGSSVFSRDNQAPIFKFQKKTNCEVCKLGEIILAKPQGYMNKSGVAVKKLSKIYNLKSNNLFVIHDDLDIQLGKFKIHFGKGPRIHNGLLSIYEQLGTKDFWHVRVGIDGDRRGKTGEEYVLENWRPEEREVIKGVIKEVINALR